MYCIRIIYRKDSRSFITDEEKSIFNFILTEKKYEYIKS